MESVAQAKGKTHVTVRLSDEALLVIHLQQEELARVKHRDITFTEALEDILLTFRRDGPFNSVKRVFHRRVFHRKVALDPKTSPLEVFNHA
jgi:hypothetical protein